jgi:hypothetical protein
VEPSEESLRRYLDEEAFGWYEVLQETTAGVFPTERGRLEVLDLFWTVERSTRTDTQISWFIDNLVHAPLGRSYQKPQWIRLVSIALVVLTEMAKPVPKGQSIEAFVSGIIHRFRKYHGSMDIIKNFFKEDRFVPNRSLYLFALVCAIYIDQAHRCEKKNQQTHLVKARNQLTGLTILFDDMMGKEQLWTTEVA